MEAKALRELILNAQDRKVKAVDVPEWGTTVHLREISAGDWEQIVQDDSGLFRVKFLSHSLCDAAGNRVFNDEQVIELSKKSAAVVGRLFTEADNLSVYGEAAVEDAKKN